MSDTDQIHMPSDQGDSVPQTQIPLSIPEIDGNEWKYIKECLDTNWVSSVGSFVNRFETKIAEYLGVSHAIATINGTSALHVALIAAGVEADDEVILPTLTFIAPANAARYIGAWPVFVDSEPKYWQIDPSKVESFLANECDWREGLLINRATGRRVKAIIPVDLLGHPCDMGRLLEIARQYGLVVVEDATESLGAKYQGNLVGSQADVGCLSFNGNKLITTGGGGMVVTNNGELADRVRYLTTQAKDDPIEYVHHEIGFNYRLTNVLSAMGVAQLERIEDFLAKTRKIANRYKEGLKDIGQLTLMPAQPNTEPAFWLYTILMAPGTSLEKRQAAMKTINDNGIHSRPLFRPIHTLPPYSNCQIYQIDNANSLYERALSLPSSVGLSDSDLDKCIEIVRNTLSG